MKRIVITVGLAVLIGAGLFAIGRYSRDNPAADTASVYSLTQGSLGMLSPGSGYVDSFNLTGGIPREEVVSLIQSFLDKLQNPELAIARIREFNYAYQIEIAESSTGQQAFDLMFGKATWQISPEPGPNVLWNMKYGPLIAELGGGYGMVGRMLAKDGWNEPMRIGETMARTIADGAASELGSNLALGDEVDLFYGFYEFSLLQEEMPVGELDVNGFSGQVWFTNWGETPVSEQTLSPDG